MQPLDLPGENPGFSTLLSALNLAPNTLQGVLLCNLYLDNALHYQRRSGDPDPLIASRLQQLAPMRLGALLGRHHHHHSQIVRRGVRVGQGLGNDVVMCQECNVARRHCSFLPLENLASRLVGSVVEDIMNVICMCSCG